MMTILFGLVVSLFMVLYIIGWIYVMAGVYGVEIKKTIDTSKNKCYNNNVKKRGN